MKIVKENSIILCLVIILTTMIGLGIIIENGMQAKEILITNEKGEASALKDFPITATVGIYDTYNGRGYNFKKYSLLQNGKEIIKSYIGNNNKDAIEIFGLEKQKYNVKKITEANNYKKEVLQYKISNQDTGKISWLDIYQENSKLRFCLMDSEENVLDEKIVEMQVGKNTSEKNRGIILGYNTEGDGINLQILLKNEKRQQNQNLADVNLASIVINQKENKLESIDSLGFTIQKEKDVFINNVMRKNNKILCSGWYQKKKKNKTFHENYDPQAIFIKKIQVYDCKNQKELYSCYLEERTISYQCSANDEYDTLNCIDDSFMVSGEENGGICFFPRE